ncbi:hypothetical protein pEaSNUABM54_00190 [Erwinia phage pEa_SNUABM_54]|nr:hypothetical protein pEaSNUABM54_00190 [Erwinia phage pEa_SNUABM_54]
MNDQQNKKKGISGLVIGLIIILSLVVLSVVGVVTAYVSAANSGARIEANIEALNQDSENVLSTVTTNIKEQAGIVGVYSKDFQDSLAKAMGGRYGAEGSKATMQWIKEQNPTLDSSLYAKVQDIINGGRKEFQISQTRKLEVCRDYKARLNYVIGGAFMRMAGYPKTDLAKECRVVSDSDSREAFDTGLNKPVSFNR